MKPPLLASALAAAYAIAVAVAFAAPGPARAALLPSPVTPAPLPHRTAAAAPATAATAPPMAPIHYAPVAAPVPSPTVFAAPPGRTAGDVRREDRTPPQALDVLGAVRYALAHSPMLLAQRATIANLDATLQRDRAAEYPTLTGELQNQVQRSGNASGNLAQFGITPQSNFSQNTAEVTAQYQLFNGTQQLVAQEAKRTLDAAKQTLRREEETVAGDVASAAYNLAALHATVALDSNDLRYQQLLLAAAQANERVGRIAGVDVLRAQVAVTRSESALVAAQTSEANSREALGVQIGATPSTVFAIPDAVPEPALPRVPIGKLIALAKSTRPDALSALLTLQAAKLADAAVDNDLRPTFAASGAFGTQVSPTSFVSQQQQIDASNAATIANYQLEQSLFPTATIPAPVLLPSVNRHQPGFYQFGLTSTFQIPIYDYGVRAANHHAARAQITSADAAYANALDGVEADVRANLRTTTTNLTQLELAKQSAALGRESARISQLQYQNGLASFTDVTQTEQTALSAETDLVSARVTYVVQYIRFRLALGPVDTASAADLRGL